MGNSVLKGATLEKRDENLRLIQELVEEMINLAEKGEADRDDVGCGILYGILLDSAYRLKKLADDEVVAHGRKKSLD